METTNENIIQFEVIADYPCSVFEKGTIVDTNKSGMRYAVAIDECSEKICLFDYPEIFKQL